MDTRLLHTFAALARTGSFTATATELHLAQSTVTTHIRTLERDLGTRLFDRLPTGAAPTEEGRRLLERAEEVLTAVAALREAAAPGGAVAGRVVLAAGESLCSARLPAVVAALRREEPEVDVSLHPASTAAAVDALRAGRADLALLLEPEADLPDIAVTEIAHEPLVFVAAPGHPLAAPGAVADWADLARESFFLHEQGCSYSDRLAGTLLALPAGPPRLTRFGSIEAARSCVAAGLGLTLLPRATVEEQLRTGRLAVVAGPPVPDVPVLLARHRRRWVSRAARAVAEELLRGFPHSAEIPGTWWVG
ncbi:LysR family transcriptional regulator [Streptomyces capparidis]